MLIRQIKETEYDKLVQFYVDMIEQMPKFGQAVGWIMGVYPTYDFLREQIAQENYYAAMVGEKIAGAMVLNCEYNEGYDKIVWSIDAVPGEFISVHLLGVLPEYHHRKIASEMVQFAIKDSKAKDMKAIRLDVIDGNSPAARLYEKNGFIHIQDLPLYYDDCGLVNFMLYEYIL